MNDQKSPCTYVVYHRESEGIARNVLGGYPCPGCGEDVSTHRLEQRSDLPPWKAYLMQPPPYEVAAAVHIFRDATFSQKTRNNLERAIEFLHDAAANSEMVDALVEIAARWDQNDASECEF